MVQVEILEADGRRRGTVTLSLTAAPLSGKGAPRAPVQVVPDIHTYDCMHVATFDSIQYMPLALP